MHALNSICKRGGICVGRIHAINHRIANRAEIAEFGHVQFNSIGCPGAYVGIDLVARGLEPGRQIIRRIEQCGDVAPPLPVNTAPTLIVGSTAFIAAAKELKLVPYTVGDKAGLFPRTVPPGACRSFSQLKLALISE